MGPFYGSRSGVVGRRHTRTDVLWLQYRRAGADGPFGDPGRDHQAVMEGYYWRIVDAERKRVIVVLCGVCRGPSGRWALVALAAHPGGVVRHEIAEPAAGKRGRFGVAAGELLDGSLEHLRVRLDDENWIDARLHPLLAWPHRAFGALGPAHLIPGCLRLAPGAARRRCAAGPACRPRRCFWRLGPTPRIKGARLPARWWGQASAFGTNRMGGPSPAVLLPCSAPPAPTERWCASPRCCAFAANRRRARAVASGRWRRGWTSPRYRLELYGGRGHESPNNARADHGAGRCGCLEMLLAGHIGLHRVARAHAHRASSPRRARAR